MNQAHVHLFSNHLPIIGSILGGFVLFYGLWTKSGQVKMAAYYVIIISTIGAVITYLTGEGAEEAVEHVQGVSKNMIDQHEDFAVVSLIGMIICGLAAIAGLFLIFRNSTQARSFAWLTFYLSVISFGLMARTGYLGGQIRHAEISSVTVTGGGESEDEED